MGFIYLTSIAVQRQLGSGRILRKSISASGAATIINGMKPHSIGRALGIGLRVAGRIASQQVAASAQAAASKPAPQPSAAAAVQNRAAGQVAGQATRGIARGVGGFLRPFRRVGGILWLEVTGVFFFLPVVVFAPTLWRIRASWLQGPDHKTFLLTAAVMAIFLYLSVTSFWRARRK
jgi:hypothetical protein